MNDSQKLDKIIQECLEKKLIGEDDVEPARVVFACFMRGADKAKVRRLSRVKNIDIYWNNLKKSGYFQADGKIQVDKDFDKNGIPLIMMILIAQGFVETHFEEEAKQTQ